MNNITSNFSNKSSNFMEEMSETPQSSSAQSSCSIRIIVWSWVLIVLKFIHVWIFEINIHVFCFLVNGLNRLKNLTSVAFKNVRAIDSLIFSLILSQISFKKSCISWTVLLLGNIFDNLINWNGDVKDFITSEFNLNSTFVCVMKSCIDIDNFFSIL